jgi:hypothetical protein
VGGGSSGTGSFNVTHPPTSSTSNKPVMGAAGGSGTAAKPIVGGPGPAPGAQPKPVEVNAYAARRCPQTPGAYTPGPEFVQSQEFTVNAQVQANVFMRHLNSRQGPNGPPVCAWSGPKQWRITAVGGGQSVTVTENMTTVTLQPGRYRINPDTTFPSDHEFTVRFSQ